MIAVAGRSRLGTAVEHTAGPFAFARRPVCADRTMRQPPGAWMNDPVPVGDQPKIPLKITIERVAPSTNVVRLAGDLDLLTAPLLRERLSLVLGEPELTLLVVDLSGVGFLGSSGLAELAAAESGGSPTLVSLQGGEIQGFDHLDKADRRPVDKTVGECTADDFDALVLPGGVANGDFIRGDERAVRFVKGFVNAGKPISVICHGGWVLIEAGAGGGGGGEAWAGPGPGPPC